MVFWLAILAGALCVRAAIGFGFFEMAILFFNAVVSVYVAIFLTPFILDAIPAAGQMPYGHALSLATIAVAVFLILYGVAYTLLIYQSRVPFPKILDIVFAGALGFLTGFLAFSFLAMLICVTPLSQHRLVQRFGFDAPAQQTNIAYLCWWCDLVHTFASAAESPPNTRQAVDQQFHRVQPGAPPPAADESKPTGGSSVGPMSRDARLGRVSVWG